MGGMSERAQDRQFKKFADQLPRYPRAVRWKLWSKRGCYRLTDFETNNDYTTRNVRLLSDEDLHWALGIKPDAYIRSIVQAEVRRREGWVARWALGISLAALLVSIVALAVKAEG
jgi:hypothetical protein